MAKKSIVLFRFSLGRDPRMIQALLADEMNNTNYCDYISSTEININLPRQSGFMLGTRIWKRLRGLKWSEFQNFKNPTTCQTVAKLQRKCTGKLRVWSVLYKNPKQSVKILYFHVDMRPGRAGPGQDKREYIQHSWLYVHKIWKLKIHYASSSLVSNHHSFHKIFIITI